MYEIIIASLTGTLPSGMSLKFNAIGGWFCGTISVIETLSVSHASPEFWLFPSP